VKENVLAPSSNITIINVLVFYSSKMGRDSSVGIATRYELNGQQIESLWGRYFPHPSTPALGLTQPPIQWVPGLFSRGVKRPGRGANHPHPSSAEVKERAQLYLCSTSGPSWPVLGRPLPYSSIFSFDPECRNLLTLCRTHGRYTRVRIQKNYLPPREGCHAVPPLHTRFKQVTANSNPCLTTFHYDLPTTSPIS
jgi:hypothetical protein